MKHTWNRELRQSNDGRSYFVTECPRCGNVREKAWNGCVYYDAGYDPVKNNTGAIGTFRYTPGNCNPKPPASTVTAEEG